MISYVCACARSFVGQPNSNQSLIRVRQRELIRPPRFVFGWAQHKFTHPFGQLVDILGIQIKPKGIAARYQPPFGCFGQMNLAALII